MRNKLTKIVLAASILLALSFTTSCTALEETGDGSSSSGNPGTSSSSVDNGSSSSGGGSNSSDGGSSSSDSGSSSSDSGSSSSIGGGFNLNSQIYQCGEDEDNDYEWVCNTYSNSGPVITESRLEKIIGTVTNGKTTNVQLPTPDEEYLEDFLGFDEDEVAEYCSEDTNIPDVLVYKARFALLSLPEVGQSYVEVGPLYIKDENENNDGEMVYVYFSKSGKISCEFEYGKINLNVTEGWNQVYVKEGYYIREYSTSNILTNPVKWILEKPYYPSW